MTTPSPPMTRISSPGVASLNYDSDSFSRKSESSDEVVLNFVNIPMVDNLPYPSTIFNTIEVMETIEEDEDEEDEEEEYEEDYDDEEDDGFMGDDGQFDDVDFDDDEPVLGVGAEKDRDFNPVEVLVPSVSASLDNGILAKMKSPEALTSFLGQHAGQGAHLDASASTETTTVTNTTELETTLEASVGSDDGVENDGEKAKEVHEVRQENIAVPTGRNDTEPVATPVSSASVPGQLDGESAAEPLLLFSGRKRRTEQQSSTPASSPPPPSTAAPVTAVATPFVSSSTAVPVKTSPTITAKTTDSIASSHFFSTEESKPTESVEPSFPNPFLPTRASAAGSPSSPESSAQRKLSKDAAVPSSPSQSSDNGIIKELKAPWLPPSPVPAPAAKAAEPDSSPVSTAVPLFSFRRNKDAGPATPFTTTPIMPIASSTPITVPTPVSPASRYTPSSPGSRSAPASPSAKMQWPAPWPAVPPSFSLRAASPPVPTVSETTSSSVVEFVSAVENPATTVTTTTVSAVAEQQQVDSEMDTTVDMLTAEKDLVTVDESFGNNGGEGEEAKETGDNGGEISGGVVEGTDNASASVVVVDEDKDALATEEKELKVVSETQADIQKMNGDSTSTEDSNIEIPEIIIGSDISGSQHEHEQEETGSSEGSKNLKQIEIDENKLGGGGDIAMAKEVSIGERRVMITDEDAARLARSMDVIVVNHDDDTTTAIPRRAKTIAGGIAVGVASIAAAAAASGARVIRQLSPIQSDFEDVEEGARVGGSPRVAGSPTVIGDGSGGVRRSPSFERGASQSSSFVKNENSDTPARGASIIRRSTFGKKGTTRRSSWSMSFKRKSTATASAATVAASATPSTIAGVAVSEPARVPDVATVTAPVEERKPKSICARIKAFFKRLTRRRRAVKQPAVAASSSAVVSPQESRAVSVAQPTQPMTPVDEDDRPLGAGVMRSEDKSGRPSRLASTKSTEKRRRSVILSPPSDDVLPTDSQQSGTSDGQVNPLRRPSTVATSQDERKSSKSLPEVPGNEEAGSDVDDAEERQDGEYVSGRESRADGNDDGNEDEEDSSSVVSQTDAYTSQQSQQGGPAGARMSIESTASSVHIVSPAPPVLDFPHFFAVSSPASTAGSLNRSATMKPVSSSPAQATRMALVRKRLSGHYIPSSDAPLLVRALSSTPSSPRKSRHSLQKDLSYLSPNATPTQRMVFFNHPVEESTQSAGVNGAANPSTVPAVAAAAEQPSTTDTASDRLFVSDSLADLYFDLCMSDLSLAELAAKYELGDEEDLVRSLLSGTKDDDSRSIVESVLSNRSSTRALGNEMAMLGSPVTGRHSLLGYPSSLLSPTTPTTPQMPTIITLPWVRRGLTMKQTAIARKSDFAEEWKIVEEDQEEEGVPELSEDAQNDAKVALAFLGDHQFEI
ncbi:hypothetical protein HDU76_003358 [Blyttiomyces sp. JEL0837]|nr:hypothetical protein HDU76_003358 [Blyttiomyces sp. JEL0837]